jgi:hypothetical protein
VFLAEFDVSRPTPACSAELELSAAPDRWWGLAANDQMDSDQDGHPLDTWLDNLSITYQP